MNNRQEANLNDFLSDMQRMQTEEMMVKDEDKEQIRIKDQEYQATYLFF
ncbi:hypothetical protein [Salisediminibacterium beveridgei]|nr:hypothetical protein [Salisediminibacterium beveridgei]